jgi:hypothetical protein
MLAAVLGLAALPAHTAQVGGQFSVTVSVLPGVQIPNTALCRVTNLPGSFGATVTVVCSTGAVVDVSMAGRGLPPTVANGGAFRFLTSVFRGGAVLGTVDSDTGPGTMTSWRIVNLDDRDYFEMLVGW